MENKKEDMVNHPKHYTWIKDICGIEVIDITRKLDFDLGNAVKYMLRAGHKSESGMSDSEKTAQDLEKAIWYLNDEIMHMGCEFMKCDDKWDWFDRTLLLSQLTPNVRAAMQDIFIYLELKDRCVDYLKWAVSHLRGEILENNK